MGAMTPTMEPKLFIDFSTDMEGVFFCFQSSCHMQS